MRWLIALIVALAVAWSAYWLIGSRALLGAVEDGVADLRENGLRIETTDLRVRGFPNRFDTIAENPVVTDSRTGLTWSAPFLQVMALSYRPNQVIVALPPEQRVEGPFGAALIETERARASATFRPVPALPLDHSSAVIEGLSVTSGGVALTADELRVATRIVSGPEGGAPDGRHVNLGVLVDDLDLPPALADALGGAEAARIDGLRLDAEIALSAPLDRRSLAAGTVGIEGLRIDALDLDWGEVGADATGALDVGADGRLSGAIDLSVRNWRALLDRAVEAGVLPVDQAETAGRALGLLGGLSGGGDRIDIPLTFDNGLIYLGPVLLGEAPRL
ncbi:DUF2125 domain-containing protein [Palleronia sediminis]|nr:DUF2125 domain-containing protein [Palleronia sediminis]